MLCQPTGGLARLTEGCSPPTFFSSELCAETLRWLKVRHALETQIT